MMPQKFKNIAVAIPCYNEAVTIAKVVKDFQAELPGAEIVVFDNNSCDGSHQLAQQAGARVVKVRLQGKGYVLQAIFDGLSSDIVVLVDGDDTYEAGDIHRLLEPIISDEADMVVGNRLQSASDESMHTHRHIGNRLIVWSINRMFGTHYQDILSGYRVFNRRFIQRIPLLTPGFETETEMTLQALDEGMVIQELPVSYRSRPADSHSKLSAFRDGYRIMLTAVILLRDHNPLRLFGMIALIFLLGALILLILALLSLQGLVAINVIILVVGAGLFAPLSALSFGLGLILNATNTRFRQLKQIFHRNQ